MPVLKRVKCPPLTKVTGERPKCQNCKKPLKARTFWVEIVGHVNQAPSAGELAVLKQPEPTWPSSSEAIKCGYEAARVFRIEHVLSWRDEQSTKLSFWRGFFDGYRWSSDGTPPLFCSQFCGVQFGVACWHAGVRITEKKPNKSEWQFPSTTNPRTT
jgi:hypothetical protein